MRATATLVFLFGCSVATALSRAFAQDAGAVAVEGYVFDKKTLKPLSNVTVLCPAPFFLVHVV